MKTLIVKFDNYAHKDYHYVVEDSVEAVAGDLAIVHNGSEYRIVTITDTMAGISSRATKTVVCLINDTVRKAYVKGNEELAEKRKLFARLEQLMAQKTENNKYRLLAQSNSEAADILKALGIG